MDKKEELKKLVDTKKLDEARVYVEELLKIEPNNTDYLYYYAKILRQSKNNEDVLKAIELYKRLSQELNKDHNFLIGKLYLQIGNSEKAIKRLNRIKDHNLLAKYELAKLLKHEKQYEESIKLFEQLRNTKQDKISLYKILKHEEEIYKDLNKLEEFKEFLLNIINNENKDAIYRILAEIFYNLEDYDTSEKYYLLVEHMNTHVKNNYLGEINYFKKEYEKALDYYFKCIETANDEEKRLFYYYRMADCYYNLGNYKEASDSYSYLIKKRPTKQTYLKLGKTELMLYKNDMDKNPSDEHLNKAYKYFKEGSTKYPDDIFLKFELAKIDIKLSRYNTALEYLDQILEVSNDKYALIEKARIYQKLHKFHYAIKLYNELLEIEDSIYIRLDLGKCYHTLHMYDKALEQYDKILEMTNNEDKCAKLEKARTLKKLGETEEVENLLNQLDDNDIYYIKSKVKTLYKENKIEEIKVILDEALKNNPNSSNLLYIIGWFNNNIGNYDVAIESFKKAHLLDKKNIQIYLLGITYFNKGDFENAIKELTKITTSNDFDIQATIALAKVYLEMKDLETAYSLLYPIVDTTRRSEVLALMFKIESLIGQNYVYKRYYNELSEETKNYINLYLENDIKLSWEDKHVKTK